MDFHLHTTASDGYLTPLQLLAEADRQGLRAIAITDHETTVGWRAITDCEERFKVRVLPGIELTAHGTDGRSVHILGYFPKNRRSRLAQLEAALRPLQSYRTSLAREMVRRLAGTPYELDWDLVARVAGKGTAVYKVHIIHAIRKRGGLPTLPEACDLYHELFDPGGSAYVEETFLEASVAIQLVRSAGGIPGLAHPGRAGAIELLDELVDGGLMGLEAHYPVHTPDMTAYYGQLAVQQGLVVTGGSDFHGGFEHYYQENALPLGYFRAPDAVWGDVLAMETLEPATYMALGFPAATLMKVT